MTVHATRLGEEAANHDMAIGLQCDCAYGQTAQLRIAERRIVRAARLEARSVVVRGRADVGEIAASENATVRLDRDRPDRAIERGIREAGVVPSSLRRAR